MPQVDVMHVCYGGMGGVRSVVNALTDQLGSVGLSTAVVPIGRREELDDDPGAWPGAKIVEPVILKHRADLSSMYRSWSVARRVKARAVFVHSPRHAIPVYLGRKLTGQKPRIVTIEHSSVNDRSHSLDINSASSLACSRAVVFLTPENEAGYPLRHIPFPALARSFVIANGVSLADFADVTRPVHRANDEFRVGMASRVVAAKDFDTLVKAMAVLQAKRADVPIRLVLAGDGPELPRIRELAHSLGADAVIDFIGSIPESRIPAFLGWLDAYVQATHGETLSMSLLQAAAARVPIVASDVAGVNDIFAQGVHARLTAHESADGLADGIIEVLTNPEWAEELADNAYAMVASRYTSAQMAIAYLEMLEGIDADGPWSEAAQKLATL